MKCFYQQSIYIWKSYSITSKIKLQQHSQRKLLASINVTNLKWRIISIFQFSVRLNGTSHTYQLEYLILNTCNILPSLLFQLFKWHMLVNYHSKCHMLLLVLVQHQTSSKKSLLEFHQTLNRLVEKYFYPKKHYILFYFLRTNYIERIHKWFRIHKLSLFRFH